MNHRKTGRKLNRTGTHRRLMFRNMMVSFLTHGRMKTTVSKAKEFRRFFEPLVTLSKQDSVAHRRTAFAILRDHFSVGRLFTEIGPRNRSRPGGYIRILKCGFRPGDQAPMAFVSFVDNISDDFSLEESNQAQIEHVH